MMCLACNISELSQVIYLPFVFFSKYKNKVRIYNIHSPNIYKTKMGYLSFLISLDFKQTGICHIFNCQKNYKSYRILELEETLEIVQSVKDSDCLELFGDILGCRKD